MPFAIYIDGKQEFKACEWLELDKNNLYIYGDGIDYDVDLKGVKEIRLVREEDKMVSKNWRYASCRD